METKSLAEFIGHKTKWTLKKYASDKDFAAGKTFEVAHIDGNCLCNEGINEINKLIAGTGGVQYDHTNANLVVGTGSGAAAAADTEATFTAPVKVVADESFPTYGTSQKITWQATFTGLVANQAWGEFGVLNAASSGKLLNRKVSAQGIKVAGQIWVLTLEITLS
jgi:hypothetical protein